MWHSCGRRLGLPGPGRGGGGSRSRGFPRVALKSRLLGPGGGARRQYAWDSRVRLGTLRPGGARLTLGYAVRSGLRGPREGGRESRVSRRRGTLGDGSSGWALTGRPGRALTYLVRGGCRRSWAARGTRGGVGGPGGAPGGGRGPDLWLRSPVSAARAGSASLAPARALGTPSPSLSHSPLPPKIAS